MDYVSPEQAQTMSGLRLALTAGLPAPYSMSARAVLDHKSVPYVPVYQRGAGANPELVAWTGHRNAPVAVYENEAPRIGWLEILNLAERLGTGPSLYPDDIDERMLMVGLINELIGENGLVWQMRVLMLGAGGAERATQEAQKNPMYADYGYSELALEAAPERVKHILDRFTQHAVARVDLAQGKPYLMGGDRLSALDIYWAYFSQLLNTLPFEQCPTPEGLKKSYDRGGELIGGCDPLLIAQRNWVFNHYLPLPVTF